MAKPLSSNFIKIVKAFSDGEFHDGETVGKTLKVTRSAIWKTIKKLSDYNIKVQAVKGKGYALLDSLFLLEAKRIKKSITPKNIKINVFESIDSTNDYLKSLPADQQIRICLAEYQSHGRGRWQRNWHSPFGKNIYFSCRYPLQKEMSEVGGLSLLVALAVRATLQSYQPTHAFKVKWPNDVIYEGKKIAGILIDIIAETHGKCEAIIGIGINVNMQYQGTPISQPWISLLEILGKAIDRNEICIRLINHLMRYLQRFETDGFSAFMAEWKSVDSLINRTIALNHKKEKLSGIAQGINSQGHLLLQLPTGLQAFAVGEVSIVKQ